MKGIFDILIVSSTEFEVKKILQSLDFQYEINKGLKCYLFDNLNVDVLISGIGIPMTTYKLTKALLQKKYDFVINAGICGSFNADFSNGTCVNVIQDEFADLGITNSDNTFLTLFDEGFIGINEDSFTNGKLITNNSFLNCDLPKVIGITVSSTSGNMKQIEQRKEKFNADIETMEGAAVAFVCLSEGIDFIQIRSVSNPVEPRTKENWDISLAINNLKDAIIDILKIKQLN